MQDDIVSRFMKKGNLLTPGALGFLKNRDIDEFLGKTYPGTIITEKEFIQPARPGITVLKNITSVPEEMSTEDFIAFYRDRYTRMQAIITSRMKKNFTSLSKIDNSRKEVFVIGIVKQIEQQDEKYLVQLEDMTSTAAVILDHVRDLEVDDVVAIRGVSAGKVIYGKQIIYPDVPARPPATGAGKACFVSDLHLEEAPASDFEKFMKWLEMQDINYLFVAGDIGNREQFEAAVQKHAYNKTVIVIPGEAESRNYPAVPAEYRSSNIVSLSNPAMIEAGGIKVLAVHRHDLSMLRKRHLGSSSMPAKQDPLVLEQVPDIVHCGHTHEPHVTNYKSITIVNSGSLLSRFAPVIVDFSSRDIQQVTSWNQ